MERRQGPLSRPAALGWLAIGAAALAVAVVVFGLVRSRPLGHDEATYAVGARAWLSGDAADAYPVYRPLAMPALLVPGVALGGADWQARLPLAIFALGHALLVMALAARLGGRPAALLAFAIQVTAAPWLWRAGEALSDIPSAVTLLAMTVLAIDDGERARGRWWAWPAIAALGAAAIYLRYGSAPTVATIMGGALIAYPARWRQVIGAGALLIAALAPFLWWSHAVTGQVTGVLDLSAEMGWRPYPGAGLVHYVTRWFTTVAGPVMGAVALLGLVVGVGAWWPRDRGRALVGHDAAAPSADVASRRRALRLLVVAALGQIALLGWRVHGEGRYIFFATSCLTAIGAAAIVARPRWTRVAMIAIALAAIPSGLFAGWQFERLRGQRAGFVQAAAAIRAHGGGRCLVVTGNLPQATWYTGCHARAGDVPPDDVTVARFDRVYALIAPGQKRQPTLTALARPGLRWRELACGERPRWCVYVGEPAGPP